MYIYQEPNWPNFQWNQEKILELLSKVKFSQGLLLGKMENLGFNLKEEAILSILTESSEIEGEVLDKEQVRASIARHLGLDIGGGVHVDRNVEGVVEMMLDATQHYDATLTKERLLGWQASLFPTGYSGMHKIEVGKFRDDKNGPMQVVSGPIGKEKVHYQAPDAPCLEKEMTKFIDWFNSCAETDGVIKSGVAHFWFVTLHPFDDGNGRIARAITDLLLARAEQTNQRFYSMSAQIRKERNGYYDVLEKAQKGSLDITNWLLWYLETLLRAIENTEDTLSSVFNKAHFWQKFTDITFNERQKKILNRFLDGFEGKLTSSKWAKLCKCSQDTAGRDISELLDKGVLLKEGSGRSTSYIPNIET